MREVLADLEREWRAGRAVALATVVRTWQSAPRDPGTAMLVRADGSVLGSVSGGCVESAVYALAEDVFAGGPAVLQTFGVSDADAFAVGLSCGGSLDVFVELVTPVSLPQLPDLAADVAAGRPVALATVVAHPDPGRIGGHLLVRPEGPAAGSVGSVGSDRADAAVTDDVRGLLASGQSEVLRYGPDGQRRGLGLEVFARVLAPPPRMLVFGASDFATALCRLGGFLGYSVTVCDARPLFATADRFPDADEVVVDWPHRYLQSEAAAGRVDEHTVVCVLTHDPKFDLPLLEVALQLPAVGYVGAMGSRPTHHDRLAGLRAAGLSEAALDRLASPIGLDLGARTPEETALSIAAEIVAQRWGGGGGRLRELEGRIHHE